MKDDASIRQIKKTKKMKTIFSQPESDTTDLYESMELYYENSLRGNKILILGQHKYIRNNVYGTNVYWKCTKWHTGCKSRAITSLHDQNWCTTRNVHNHSMHTIKDEIN